jgi:hypothetical protein
LTNPTRLQSAQRAAPPPLKLVIFLRFGLRCHPSPGQMQPLCRDDNEKQNKKSKTAPASSVRRYRPNPTRDKIA